MRHIHLVLVLIFALGLAAPAAGAQTADPVLENVESTPSIGPYCGPNG